VLLHSGTSSSFVVHFALYERKMNHR